MQHIKTVETTLLSGIKALKNNPSMLLPGNERVHIVL